MWKKYSTLHYYQWTYPFFSIPKCHCEGTKKIIFTQKASFRLQCSGRIHFTQDHLCFLHPNGLVPCSIKQQEHSIKLTQCNMAFYCPPQGIHLRDCMGECLINCCMNHLISSSQDHRADNITTEMVPSPKQPNAKMQTHTHPKTSHWRCYWSLQNPSFTHTQFCIVFLHTNLTHCIWRVGCETTGRLCELCPRVGFWTGLLLLSYVPLSINCVHAGFNAA